MKFLVLGANGMAGHTIGLYLSERGHDVVGFARSDSELFDCIVGDAHDLSLLKSTINDNAFDVVVNAIGLLNDFANRRQDEAVFLNSYLPHYLAEVTKDESARVFHLSTDCVFSGNTGPYSEYAVPNGTSIYDRSKALGELWDSKNLTFRNSIVGPDLKPEGIGLLNWFLAQEGKIRGFTEAIWTGLTTLELAKAIEHSATESNFGLVNMVPDASISKFDLLNLFNIYINHGRAEIIPSNDLRLDKTLIRENRESSFIPSSYDEQIHELSLWMLDHKNLYPHYSLT